MAKNLKSGEKVTVDRVVEFDPKSESFINGLPQITAGQVGVVVDAAPQGRASIVDFDGIQATVSNQRLQRLETPPVKGKRGRKKRATTAASAKVKTANNVQKSSPDETSEQIITQLANTLLLNGGLKQNGEVVIQLRFDELPESVKTQIRKLIDAKLALSRTGMK